MRVRNKATMAHIVCIKTLCVLTVMHLSKATYSAFRLYIFCQYVCPLGIESMTFVLLTQCSTTESQEQLCTSTVM